MLTVDQSPHIYGATPKLSATVQTSGLAAPSPRHKHIWIITGPAGCGKSTVAQYLAQQLQLPYIEGDEYHPQANIEKMAAGIPLTDADRWDWLILLRQQSTAALATGAKGVVLTCSALKRKYRDVIRVAAYEDHQVLVHFIYLRADEETLLARVKARQGHYMKDDMVRSQFLSLEEPTEAEKDKDVFSVDVSGTPAEVQNLALGVVQKVFAEDSVVESS